MERITGSKTHQELADFFQDLPAEWNHLELNFIHQEQADQFEEDSDDVRVRAYLEEYYKLSRQDTKCQYIDMHSEMSVERGSYPLGKPWIPFQIKMSVDAHSHLPLGKEDMWEHYFFGPFKELVKDRLGLGYVIVNLEGLRNQKGNFPGSINADAKIDLRGIREQE